MASDVRFRAWEEFGEGFENVYLYYYPSQKTHAHQTGQLVWECKIGHTTESDVHDYIHRTKVNED